MVRIARVHRTRNPRSLLRSVAALALLLVVVGGAQMHLGITPVRAVGPTLGDYPNTAVGVGANTTIAPDALPTGATSINVATNSNFKGTFTANPATGVVRVTNAHPAGVYIVTARAFDPAGPATKTFTLTVVSGTICNDTVQFTNAADVSPGANPFSVAVGDFNNDGNQDLAVANQNANTVSIRLGDGLGGFSGTTTVSVGTLPLSVAIGDFNNDGNQDFATANRAANTVSIRLGNGLGGFSGTTTISVGSQPFSVAIGDFNNDGNQDFATANINANTVSIRLGDGSGDFSGTTNVNVGSQPVSVAIGDFNNDGRQDFATANQNSDTVSIRLGDGSGGFSGSTNVSVGSHPHSVAIGDFNNDGKQDFAVAHLTADTVSIHLGDGSGGFNGATNIGVGSQPVSVAIGDFNNDGKQDFAAVNQSAYTVSIRFGDGSGGFSGITNVSVGSDSYSVAIGDFNNDGKQDFATADYGANTVSIRLGSCVVTPTPTPCPGPTNISLGAGATGEVFCALPIGLTSARSASQLPPEVSAIFSWNNGPGAGAQSFNFWFRGFPNNFQTLTTINPGSYYFFQSTGAGSLPNTGGGTTLAAIGAASIPTTAGANGAVWSGGPHLLNDLGAYANISLVTAIFSWNNGPGVGAQSFNFWFRGFPNNFQTLTNGIARGKYYFFQAPAGPPILMD